MHVWTEVLKFDFPCVTEAVILETLWSKYRSLKWLSSYDATDAQNTIFSTQKDSISDNTLLAPEFRLGVTTLSVHFSWDFLWFMYIMYWETLDPSIRTLDVQTTLYMFDCEQVKEYSCICVELWGDIFYSWKDNCLTRIYNDIFFVNKI